LFALCVGSDLLQYFHEEDLPEDLKQEYVRIVCIYCYADRYAMTLAQTETDVLL